MADNGRSFNPAHCFLGLVLLPLVQLCSPVHADWPGFLGPGGNPVDARAELPKSFSVSEGEAPATNIAWRIPLEGRSVSGPIVVDGKVITTSSSAMEGRWIHVAAVDAESGALLWERSSKSTGRPYCHPTSANAAPTPCSDGNLIFAFFSSNDLVCYDLDGNLQWFRSLTDKHPLAGNDVGMSSSPVVTEGVVVVMVECQADSFTAGLDAETGELLWEIPRPKSANWSSPRTAVCEDGKGIVVLQSGSSLVGVEPRSGESLWEVDLRCSTVASSVFADGKLYVPAGGLKVFTLPGGNLEPKMVWETSRISPNSASMLVSSFGLIGLNRSILVCCDEAGERLWNARLEDAGQFWATPVIAGNLLYAFAMNGKCFVVELSQDSAKVIEECELGAEVLGSPAIYGNALFVRSTDALWKIAAN